MYYNDQPPDMIFYQGLALRDLGDENEANCCFSRLLQFGRQHRNDTPEIWEPLCTRRLLPHWSDERCPE
jgi:hypothetical protein